MPFSKGSDFAPHNMTGASSPSPYVASDNGHYIVLPGWLAFDGNAGTDHYFVGTTTGNVALLLDIGAGNAKKLYSFAVQVNTVPEATRAPKDFTIQGSNDNSNFTDLGSTTNQTSWGSGETREFNCSVVGTTYRYFRLVITANNGDPTYTQVAELYLYEATGSADLVPELTDSISLSDALGNVYNNIWGLSDDSLDALWADSVELSKPVQPLFIDSLNIQDELDVLVISQAKKVWAILVGDNLSFNDDLGRFATYTTLLGDSYSITDRTAALNEKFLVLADSVSLLDAIGNIDSFLDGLSLLDAANYNLDAVPITDYVFLLADSILIGDDGSTFISAPEFLSVADSILLADRAAVRVQANLTDYLRRYLNDVPTPIT